MARLKEQSVVISRVVAAAAAFSEGLLASPVLALGWSSHAAPLVFSLFLFLVNQLLLTLKIGQEIFSISS